MESYEIHVNGEWAAAVEGDAVDARADAAHYARMYQADGEVKVYRVFKSMEEVDWSTLL